MELFKACKYKIRERQFGHGAGSTMHWVPSLQIVLKGHRALKERKGQSLPLTDITCFQTTSFHIFTCIHRVPIFSSSAYVKLQWDICRCKPKNASVTCYPIVSYLDQIQHCYLYSANCSNISNPVKSSKRACLAQTGKFLRVKVFHSTNYNSDCRFCMCYWCKMQH